MNRAYIFICLGFTCSVAGVSLADERLPLAFIRIPETVATVFVAETATARFHRFDIADGQIERGGALYMSIGQAGAGKKQSGDKRTPLGAYFITERLDTSQLHEKYGVMAFPLDYPNIWDRAADRDGDGIWLHGVDPVRGQRPARDTDGCIALRNGDLSALANRIRDNVTPVLVLRTIDWGDPAENDSIRLELESSIATWVEGQASGDLHAYLSSYDDGFQRWGMTRSEWSSLALRALNKSAARSATVTDLLLLRYPEEDGVYLSRFQLQLARDESNITVRKRLFWRRDAAGELRIVAEDDG